MDPAIPLPEDRPCVSVIIPVKNARLNLERLLDSLDGLEYPKAKLEVLICDNGSTDGTQELGRTRGHRVLDLPTLSISGLRNRGAAVASGEVLAFVDSDCTVGAGWLEAALGHLKMEPVGAAGCYPFAPADATWVQSLWNLKERVRPEVFDASWLPSMNLIIRRKVFEGVRGFDEQLKTCEDVDLCYRLRDLGWRIIWDQAIHVTHYGEPVDLGTLFRKERWHGSSNLRGLWRHGLRTEELPSLALPALVFASYALPAAALLTGPFLAMLVSPTLLIPPSIALAGAVRTAFLARKPFVVPRLTAIYLVYLTARAASLVHR